MLELGVRGYLKRRSRLFIFFGGFTISLLWNIFRGMRDDFFPDGEVYLNTSEELLKFISGKEVDSTMFHLPLGISILLIPLVILPMSEVVIFKFMLCMVYGLNLVLAQKILEKLKVNSYLSLSILLFILFDPFLLSFTSGIQSEIFASCAILIWLIMLVDINHVYSLWINICIQFFSFFIVITRPNFLIIYLAVMFIHLKGMEWKFRRRIHLSILSAFIIPFVTFQLWTFKLYGGFIFLAVNGPMNFLLSCKGYLAPQIFGLLSDAENREINQRYFNEIQNLNYSIDAKASVYDRYRYQQEVAFEECNEKKLNVLALYLLKLFLIWRPFLSAGSQSTVIFLFSLIVGILLLFSWMGVLIYRVEASSTFQRFRNAMFWISLTFAASLLPSAYQLRHKIAAFETVQWICLALILQISFSSKFSQSVSDNTSTLGKGRSNRGFSS